MTRTKPSACATPQPRRRIRCAIYTRKSTEEGLDQDFNSLDAQYEACAAFIASQKAEGWELVPDRFDDGGLSGGTLERPALQRLLALIDARQIDQIIVYKIDRLTRALSDFSKIVDRLDKVAASFVSVTQSFNTATSMGRLTLNMLLSFAQFEREVTAERIRDKIAASKKKGLWMGGTVPLGYQPQGRSLVVDPQTAPTISKLYDLYERQGTLSAVADAASKEGLGKSPRRSIADMDCSGPDASTTAHEQGAACTPFTRSHIHQILTNPIYAGRIRHYDVVYPGQHAAIIDPARWEDIQTRLAKEAARPRGSRNTPAPSSLKGKLFDAKGIALTPTHSQKKGRRHRYYISRALVSGRAKDHPDAWRLPAITIEGQVAAALRSYLGTPTNLLALQAAPDTSNLAALPTLAKRFADLSQADLLACVESVTLTDGKAVVRLAPKAIAQCLGREVGHLNVDALAFDAPLNLRRRGVETRLVIGDAQAEIDMTLLRNIALARDWYAHITGGKTLGTVAEETGTDRHRITQMIPLAFLAPDVLAQVVAGKQPTGFTSEWVKSNTLPMAWGAQRDLIAGL
ncbi:recombinase family protein [Yoonia sp. GPGPB17]|uniref:recombinase family protein n=1 Tax=Yoonia sp. GPGPB17 TaxID=3026147 RepID=UPI0030C02B56